jgi:hypothetical protein
MSPVLSVTVVAPPVVENPFVSVSAVPRVTFTPAPEQLGTFNVRATPAGQTAPLDIQWQKTATQSVPVFSASGAVADWKRD